MILDTNVLLYATGGDHPLREPCRDLLTAVAGGDVPGHVTDVVIAEFLHIRARRTDRAAAATVTRDLIDTMTGVVSADDRVRTRALTIFGTTTRLSSNDALIAAVALETGFPLVSADLDFSEVPTLHLIAPDASDAPWR